MNLPIFHSFYFFFWLIPVNFAHLHISPYPANLIRHEHELMIGLQEPDTWGKLSERDILFLLLVKYRLLDMRELPRVLMDTKGQTLWRVWCDQHSGSDACKAVLVPAEKFAREDVPVLSADECANLINHSRMIKSETDVQLVHRCMEEASRQLDEKMLEHMHSEWEVSV